ncbi:DUF262 domain-containing protein [Flavobacterium sp. CYK-55]|uniref:DUF262 domain-containing protein n=1 Tax=Flavobacterium sp. CYK-55 TaxID=2835529 RepID=UPI001BCAC20D|nr:DUF262 domain-containing protein [Flavobacterium sp. CYK-55]MBS7786615.1 DUF262 domain-containing protein [Flavobacterium sp. CYK-55]
MKTKNYLKEQNILFLLSQNNFIIPEIQREYVWGNNPKVLLNFIENIKSKASDGCLSCGTPTNKSKINIGFLYTYKPDYVTIDNERFLDENLIDGQQRFTTLFLLLFYFSIKEVRKDDFLNLIRYEELLSMAFDYKVRNLTHRFLLELVEKSDTVEQLLNLQGQTWFLNDYKKDPSIKAIIKALEIICSFFVADKTIYFDYILSYVRFWHFKTEATSQGEELYITMNARGEALSKNEETKASIMVKDDQQNEWGKKWENWQDFFWKRKGLHNSNSDSGFNEFLRWVQIIEMTEQNEDINNDDDDENAENVKEIIRLIQADEIELKNQYLTLEILEKYFKALDYIFNEYHADTKTLETIYTIKTDLLPLRLLHPVKKHIEQMECFLLLPAILYCKKLIDAGKPINNQNLFRLIRFLSTYKDDVTIRKTINKQVINALKMVTNLLENSDDIADITLLKRSLVSKSILTNDVDFKLRIFKAFKNRNEIEDLFWKYEDHTVNKGKIGHLIQASYFNQVSILNFEYKRDYTNVSVENFNLEIFKSIAEKFAILFEDNDNISNKIWSLLLLSGYFKKGNYYNVHDLVVCPNSDKEAVIQNKSFLKHLHLLKTNQTLANYIEQTNKTFFDQYKEIEDLKNEDDYIKQIFVYQLALRSINNWNWSKGKNFGIFNRNKDKNFNCFFNHKYQYQHYIQRWQGAEYNFFEHSKMNVTKYLKTNNIF